MTHGFQAVAPDSKYCAECGQHENEHFWKCEKHDVVGNGEFNCPNVEHVVKTIYD